MAQKHKQPRGLLRSLYSAQFIALFKKDVITVVQGGYGVFFIRMCIPPLLLIVLFALDLQTGNISESQIKPSHRILDYKLPSCFHLDGSSENFGSKINTRNCTSLAYYPSNKYTDMIATELAASLQLKIGKGLIGYTSPSDYLNDEYKPMYVVHFDGDANVSSFPEYLHNLSVMIYYNSTYTDYPHYLQLYNEEKITQYLTFEVMVIVNPSSSFPTILQYHINSAIMKLNGIVYDPTIRQVPNAPNSRSIRPKSYLTYSFIAVPVLFQFVFTFLVLSHEKGAGNLDALRLAGISDLIYHAETFVFHYAIYLLGVLNQIFILYGFPKRFDYYQFIEPNIFLMTIIISGMYATALAMFLNIITTQRAGISVMVVFLALFLIWMMLLMMLDPTIQYDPSFMPRGVQFIVDLVYPFILSIYSLGRLIFAVSPTGVMNQERLQLELVNQNQNTTLTYSGCFRPSQLSCQMRECTFVEPSLVATLFFIALQTIGLLFGTWVLGEWLPINSSACRPPWKLFTRRVLNIDREAFTLGALRSQKHAAFKARAEGMKELRHELPPVYLNKCLAEATQQCDAAVIERTKNLLSKPLEGNEVLVVHHLHKTFRRPAYKGQRILLGDEHLAIKSVSFKLAKGEILGIAGHNGAGKSTTIAVITGATKPDKPGFKVFKNDEFSRLNINNAWVGQFNIRNDIHQIRRVLGFCPQFNTNVYQDLTVYQNIVFQCQIKNIPMYDHKRIAQSLLLKIGLWEWRNKKLKQLSGGMQRRVSIAMSMVNPRNKIIILDEPSTGLDPQTKRIIWQLIKDGARNSRKVPVLVGSSRDHLKLKRVREDPPGVIITSHDMAELNSLCDQIEIMSSGQVVAAGTALELKNKFGKGYVLSVICKSADDCVQFSKLYSQTVLGNIESKVRIIDHSGQLIQYALPNNDAALMMRSIRLIEQLIQRGALVNDYQIERTSMDEVFVTVGNMFQLDNGGSGFENGEKNTRDATKCEQSPNVVSLPDYPLLYSEPENLMHSSTVKDEASLGIANPSPPQQDASLQQDNSHKGPDAAQGETVEIQSDVELTSESEVDRKVNGECVNAETLTQEQINQILSPQRQKPNIYKALMFKMAASDRLARGGWLLFVALPIVMLLVCLFFADWLIPTVMGTLMSFINQRTEGVDLVCQYCQAIKMLDLEVPDCDGYDAWGFPNLCPQIDIHNGAAYQAPPVWYGDDFRHNSGTTNLYAKQEHPVNLYVFDRHRRLGEYTQDAVLSHNEQGEQVTERTTLEVVENGRRVAVPLSRTVYKYTNDVGQPYSAAIEQRLLSITGQAAGKGGGVLGSLPVKPIAVQQYNLSNGAALNSFQIMTDMVVRDGYLEFNSADELDERYQKYLLSGLPFQRLRQDPAVLYPNYTADVNGRPGIWLYMDDKINFQHMKQLVAQNVPVGFVDMDRDGGDDVFRPFISSFIPAKQHYNFYKQYSYQVRLLPSESYSALRSTLKQLGMDDDAMDTLINRRVRFQLVPTTQPSIINNILGQLQTSPQTSLMDINARLGNAILRARVDPEINVRYGVQMMPTTPVNIFDNISMFVRLCISAMLMTLANYVSLIKLGNHIVTDRQYGIRRALYLNGVTDRQYWWANFSYCIFIGVLVQVVITVFANIFFQLSIVRTIEPTIQLLLSVCTILSSTSIAMLISSMFKKSQYYITTILIIIVVSAIAVMFDMGTIQENAPWYTWVIQSVGYSKFLITSSYMSYTIEKLRTTTYGYLLLWMYIESVLFLLLSYYLDRVIPYLNGFKAQHPCFCFRIRQRKTPASNKGLAAASQEHINMAFQYNSGGQAIGHDGLFVGLSTQSHIQLNTVDVAPQLETARDRAALDGDDRMDVDVIKERQLIRYSLHPETPVIVTNLQKLYGDFVALRDLSFHIPLSQGGGSVFSLLGPNGAAKTTTIHMMVGLLQQTKGHVWLHGYNMADPTQARRAYQHIGLCTQFDIYLPALTVRQHLQVFAAVHGVPWKDIGNTVEKLAQFIHLAGVLDKKVQTLSGGMKRRLSLAIALVG